MLVVAALGGDILCPGGGKLAARVEAVRGFVDGGGWLGAVAPRNGVGLRRPRPREVHG
jgi:hypothetical protein